jgi:hypothetical protein
MFESIYVNRACSNPLHPKDSLDHVDEEDVIGPRSASTSPPRAANQTYGDSGESELESPLHCS